MKYLLIAIVLLGVLSSMCARQIKPASASAEAAKGICYFESNSGTPLWAVEPSNVTPTPSNFDYKSSHLRHLVGLTTARRTAIHDCKLIKNDGFYHLKSISLFHLRQSAVAMLRVILC